MSFVRSLLLSLLTGGALLGGASRAAAQTAEPRNLATDTLQPANAAYYRPVSRLGTVGGQQLHVFITNVSERGTGIEFTWRNPLAMPRPKPVFITSEQLQWVRLDGHYYEPVRVAKAAAHGLALRLATGPRVEVFDVATPKKGVPIPLPVPGGGGGLLWTGAFSAKYNHAWYLRRPGEKTMAPVPDGKQFAPFLADYLADAPDLAAAIRAGAAGHRYEDVPALLSTYNQLTPAGTH
ncbi:hypothetical protein [Hymenobacter bucti]|uniref:Uncharacterized protein n=1 Tax=Hymenobacter bucti TaxID=1844114 RepID=A0ABW4QWF1_9BACT